MSGLTDVSALEMRRSPDDFAHNLVTCLLPVGLTGICVGPAAYLVEQKGKIVPQPGPLRGGRNGRCGAMRRHVARTGRNRAEPPALAGVPALRVGFGGFESFPFIEAARRQRPRENWPALRSTRLLEYEVPPEADDEGEIVTFVQGAISSLCALELLLLLRGRRQRPFVMDEAVRELRSSELAVTQALDRLKRSALIEDNGEGAYRYQQTSPQLDAICERLQSLYARKPLKIINAILSAPDEKLRTFADAFRLSGKTK